MYSNSVKEPMSSNNAVEPERRPDKQTPNSAFSQSLDSNGSDENAFNDVNIKKHLLFIDRYKAKINESKNKKILEV